MKLLLKYNILPKPERYETLEGTYTVSSSTEVLCSKEFTRAGHYLTAYLKTNPRQGEGAITFKKVEGMAKESYVLRVAPDGITVRASDERGAFYGAVTLKMILMQATKTEGKAVVNGLLISDKPHHGYRGLQIDESRHFFGKEVVLRVLDQMAMLKLNAFHWHLSDDQGFRIESKVFPELNSIGSRRRYAGLKGCGMEYRGGEYFHYYTQEEIREIEAYANSLYIDVIPEIDLPGHTRDMLAAHPELSCTGEPIEVMCENGVASEILCAGNEAVYAFLEQLLAEMCGLFKGKYFHIGGDEATDGHRKHWQNCPKCRAAMEKNDLKTPRELQGYFMTRVNEMVKKHGKTAIAWNDVIGDSFDDSIVCQYWLPNNLGTVRKQAFKRDMILSPTDYFYFDVKYAQIPLRKVYRFDEALLGLAKPGQRVLGLECEHWSEFLDTETALQFSMFPRTAAFAEVAWTEPQIRRYSDFKKRLAWLKTYMRKVGIIYSRVEKGNRLTVGACRYHLGEDGAEFARSEKLRALETEK